MIVGPCVNIQGVLHLYATITVCVYLLTRVIPPLNKIILIKLTNINVFYCIIFVDFLIPYSVRSLLTTIQ